MLIKMVLKLLIKIASVGLSWLPDHVPIAWPDTGILTLLVGFLALGGDWMHVPWVLTCLGLIIGISVAMFLYQAWRTVLGFIPTFK